MGRTPDHVRVLNLLRAGPQCGTDFIKHFLPSYPKRIHRLRHMNCCPKGVIAGCELKQGYQITTVRCDLLAHHHDTRQWVYRLVGLDQPKTLPVPPAAVLVRNPRVDPEFDALILEFGPARAALIAAGIEPDPRVDHKVHV